MEGVGGRLGRTSTRHGPVTVFTGPVRKWKKKWVNVSFSNNNNSKKVAAAAAPAANCDTATDGNNGSHLLLYKWTPLSQSNNGNINVNGNGVTNSPSEDAEEHPRRRFKYVPIAVLEEQNREIAEDEATETIDDEAKPNDTDPSMVDPNAKKDGFDEKPDINDAPMKEKQEENKFVRQDLNESNLDLSLGLNAHEGESKKDQTRDGTSEEG